MFSAITSVLFRELFVTFTSPVDTIKTLPEEFSCTETIESLILIFPAAVLPFALLNVSTSLDDAIKLTPSVVISLTSLSAEIYFALSKLMFGAMIFKSSAIEKTVVLLLTPLPFMVIDEDNPSGTSLNSSFPLRLPSQITSFVVKIREFTLTIAPFSNSIPAGFEIISLPASPDVDKVPSPATLLTF